MNVHTAWRQDGLHSFDAPLQRVSCDPGAARQRASTTHPLVVKIGCNVVTSNISSIDPVIERIISLENVPSRTRDSPPRLAISHVFKGPRLAHAPRCTTFHPAYKSSPTSPTKCCRRHIQQLMTLYLPSEQARRGDEYLDSARAIRDEWKNVIPRGDLSIVQNRLIMLACGPRFITYTCHSRSCI
jgi:hypothetical protein